MSIAITSTAQNAERKIARAPEHAAAAIQQAIDTALAPLQAENARLKMEINRLQGLLVEKQHAINRLLRSPLAPDLASDPGLASATNNEPTPTTDGQ